MRFAVHDELGDLLATVEAADRGSAELKALELFGPRCDLYCDPVGQIDEALGVFAPAAVRS